MSRSLSNLRRGLLGIAFLGSLGFGATQAFADPSPQARRAYCSSGAEIRACLNSCQSQGMLANCDPDFGCICEPR